MFSKLSFLSFVWVLVFCFVLVLISVRECEAI